jgi:hypothetical protein
MAAQGPDGFLTPLYQVKNNPVLWVRPQALSADRNGPPKLSKYW